ncbi:MAG TPA: cysteine desulfurase family protein [Acidimicrobiales bacterium]|nr:cysteine desulfurase family protein [Acidimicrobiales bacterium]
MPGTTVVSTITYLDHAATAPLRPEVAAAMASVHERPLGNPTGSHPPAQRARALLEEARETIADLLGRDAGEIVFTSGGTESANLAVLGSLEAALHERGEALALFSAVEHPAVRESVKAAARAGADVEALCVDANGVVDRNALEGALSPRCTLVAVMAANNETGVIEPLADVVDAARRRAPQAYVFTDAVQAASFLDLGEATEGADMVGLSAHKFGGPVGIGVLAVAARVSLWPRQHGGGQERERRSGTQDVAGAVGMATALQLVAKQRQEATERVSALRDRLAAGLLAAMPWAHRTVAPGVATLPGHLHLCLPGVEREELLVGLGREGVCVSGGSSCASGALEPSDVLAAMGVPAAVAIGAVRFTLGYDTTEDDVERALAVVPSVANALRST